MLFCLKVKGKFKCFSLFIYVVSITKVENVSLWSWLGPQRERLSASASDAKVPVVCQGRPFSESADSWHFLAFVSTLDHVICSSHLMPKSLPCRYIRNLSIIERCHSVSCSSGCDNKGCDKTLSSDEFGIRTGFKVTWLCTHVSRCHWPCSIYNLWVNQHGTWAHINCYCEQLPVS